MIGIMLIVRESEWISVPMQFMRLENALGISYRYKRMGEDEMIEATRGDKKAVRVVDDIYQMDPLARMAHRSMARGHLRDRIYSMLDAPERAEWARILATEFPNA